MNHRTRIFAMLALVLGGASHAMAADAPSDESKTPPSSQSESQPAPTVTGKWLNAQASGKQASSSRPSLSGPILDKVHQRYVNSFGYPIPERLTDAKAAPTK
ncbi:MAG: DUF3613 domain-containing protein [Aquabacterium sp.]